MANQDIWYQIGALLRRLFGWDTKGTKPQRQQRSGSRPGSRPGTRPASQAGAKPKPRAERHQNGSVEADQVSPGQFGSGATRDASAEELRTAKLDYAPSRDGNPDPGEVVWTWVPYVENDGRGKDRPVLIIGRLTGGDVLGCYLSTKEHRGFIPMGAGKWDSERRQSYLSPERLLRVSHDGMRREGAIVPQDAFTNAVRGVLAYHGVR